MKEIIKNQAKQRVAIFDIDGTIFRSSLLIEITEALIKEKIFPTKARGTYEKVYKKWNEREGSYEDYIKAVVETYMKNIKGVNYNVFSKIAKRVIAKNNDKVYIYTRDLVKKLKKKNYYLLAISSSPQKIVQEFCKKLGFNKTYGTIYEIGKDNKFTGIILHENLIFDKAKILKRAMKKEGLILRDSIGVGDTEGDIPLLKMVKIPICFNPNKKLYTTAKRRGWKIVVERKDMIYSL